MVTMESPLHSPLRSPLHSAVVSKWGADAYAVLGFEPELVIDAVEDYYRANSAATTFADMVTFSRASGATYTDSSGVLQTAASGVARTAHHIYNGTSWVKAGLLVEPTAATNLVTYSAEFDNAAWAKSETTVSANSTTAPDGASTADLIVPSVNSLAHWIAQLANVVDTTVYTQSIYAKAGGYSWLQITESTSFGVTEYVNINLTTGAIGNASGYSSSNVSVVDAGNGWWRISVRDTAVSTTTGRFLFVVLNADTASRAAAFAGDGTSGVYLWGAQLEAGSVPSSYIPTAGSTATRAAETVTLAAAKVPYSATALWIQMEGYMTYADNNVGASVNGRAGEAVLVSWYVSNSNYIDIPLRTDAGTGQIRFAQEDSSVIDAVQTAASYYAPGINVPFNIASRHGSTFINGAVDGTALTADTTPVALAALSSTNLQLAYSGGPMIISKFRMGTGDPGDAGIAEASA